MWRPVWRRRDSHSGFRTEREKGGKGRTSIRRPVPITLALARKLERAVAGRPSDAPLLTRPDGSAWNPNSMELVRLFAQVAERLGIEQTAYCLRHSSIVRSLIAGTPTRVVAALHDTSTVQLERVYSAFIADHADTVARRGLIDTSTPITREPQVATFRQGSFRPRSCGPSLWLAWLGSCSRH